MIGCQSLSSVRLRGQRFSVGFSHLRIVCVCVCVCVCALVCVRGCVVVLLRGLAPLFWGAIFLT